MNLIKKLNNIQFRLNFALIFVFSQNDFFFWGFSLKLDMAIILDRLQFEFL